MSQLDIRIGTLIQGTAGPGYLQQILPYGFESFQVFFWQHLKDANLKRLAGELHSVLSHGDNPAVISSLGMFGNPLEDKQTAKDWAKCIDAAPLFGCDLVCGFTGCISGKPVPESLPAFRKVWAPLVQRAADKGVRIAWENCDMGGDWERASWNIAHAPTAWEMIFNQFPQGHVGLEWEPAHQLCSLVDPLPQLRKWVKKVFHLHGKDATVLWDVIRTEGIRSGKPWVFHRTPGFGDTNWADVISTLRMGGYKGSIDIEGWHDPVYRGELEMTGQVRGLRYLRECRGGEFVVNPR